MNDHSYDTCSLDSSVYSLLLLFVSVPSRFDVQYCVPNVESEISNP